MAVYMLNFSVDTRDIKLDVYESALNPNDLESFLELILEEGLDMEGAIGEHDEQDGNGANLEKAFKCVTFGEGVEVPVPMKGAVEKTGTLYLQRSIELVYLDRGSPPPEMA